MPTPKIFISYAHADITYQKELVKRLKPLKRKGEIILWHDGAIKTGEEWDSAIKQHLEDADIIIIMLSADFIASDYIYEHELPRIVERRRNGEIQLIPIVARSITLDDTGIEMYQCLPQDEYRRLKPIVEWDDRAIDKVWVQIDKKIRGVIDSFKHPDKDNEEVTTVIDDSPPSPDTRIGGNAIDLPVLKKELKLAVAKDLGKALKKLEDVLSSDSYLYNSMIQLQAQHSAYKRDSRLNLLNQENATIQRSKITYAFQSLVDELDIDDLI